MKQRTLLELVPTATEADYIQHFQALATVNLEIRQRGATAERLLRRSILEMDVGNFQASLDAAQDALDLRPDLNEARYQEGMSLIMLAFTKLGVVAGAAGMATPIARPRTLLEQAAESFGKAVRANPEDEEAQDDLAATSAFLANHPEDDALEDEMRRVLD